MATTRLRALWIGLLSAAAAHAQVAAPARAAPPAVSCLTGPDRVADIGSPIVGVVRSVEVDIGARVRKGELLLTLASDVERAGVQAAAARSGIDADVQAAQAGLEFARQRHQQAQALRDQGFVSDQAAEQARIEREIAQQKLAQAKGQRQVASRELDVIQAQLRQRSVLSPFDGTVTERYVETGERVDDKPMLRVARLDPLRVDLVMPAARYGSVALDDRLPIALELPGVAPQQAQVTQIDPVIDAASNTFRVRLKLPNPGNALPAGVRCRLDAAPSAPYARLTRSVH